MIEEGTPAPDFALQSDAGETIRLSDLRGKPVVLYFYPKDDTTGCTTQACGIRDAYGEFEAAGAVVLGVSPDDVVSHQIFRADYELPFTLLADPDHEVAEKYELPFTLLADTDRQVVEAYDVWKERTNYGKTYMGIERSTFVVDRDGNLAKELRKVKPAEHAQQVLDVLDTL